MAGVGSNAVVLRRRVHQAWPSAAGVVRRCLDILKTNQKVLVALTGAHAFVVAQVALSRSRRRRSVQRALQRRTATRLRFAGSEVAAIDAFSEGTPSDGPGSFTSARAHAAASRRLGRARARCLEVSLGVAHGDVAEQ